MDLKSENLINYLSESILHSDISGFEILELLDIRTQLASREPLMDDNEKARIEKIDRKLSQFAVSWVELILEVADLAEMRKRNHVLPSHWWWYLDELALSKKQKSVLG
jgi:hypothetical protein